MNQSQEHEPLTPTLLLQLAAPHTWPAAIMPTLVGTALALHDVGTISVSLVLAVLAIVICMQSAVNTLNDYFDFKKGADTAENQVDKNDAVLVFNNVNPKSVKRFAIVLIVLAFVIGSYVIYRAGWIPFVLGVIGAAVLCLYSGGRLPISYLPIGEFVSGFTMGTLILVATYQALTLTLSWEAFVWSIPVLIGIGLILMTNNTCDIEKDVEAKRKTLSVVVGRKKARKLYHAALYSMVLLVVFFGCIWWTKGLVIVPFALLALYPFGKALVANPLVLQSRVAAMSQILTVNVVVDTFYAALILCDVCGSLTI